MDESAEGLAHARHLLGIRVKGSDIPGLLFDFHGLVSSHEGIVRLRRLTGVLERAFRRSSDYEEHTESC